MTIAANAPEAIVALADQLDDCASWPNGMSTWYPRKDDGSSSGDGFAILTEVARRSSPMGVGAGGVVGGELQVVLHLPGDAFTVADVETLARDLIDELMEQQGALVFRAGECAVSGVPTDPEIAADANLVAIAMNLPWGLNV